VPAIFTLVPISGIVYPNAEAVKYKVKIPPSLIFIALHHEDLLRNGNLAPSVLICAVEEKER
jgi:hypothetical protein